MDFNLMKMVLSIYQSLNSAYKLAPKVIYFKNRILRILKNIEGEDSLGWWWHPKKMMKMCKKFGLECKILDQNEKLPYHRYRFDVLITNTK
jgi:hypothetical protein